MLSTESLWNAAQVIALATIFPLIPQHPFSVWSSTFNTASFPPELQQWRSVGSYHTFAHSGEKGPSLVNIFYIDLVGDSSTSSTDTLLLLHGFPTSSVDFKGPFMWRLQPEFARIIALDYPGYGLSDKPRGGGPTLYTIHTFADVVENLLEALGVSAAHVLAHDVGDTVAQELLARHNARQAAAGMTGGGGEGLDIQSVAFLNGGLLPELHRPLLMQKLLSNAYIGPMLGPFMRPSRLAKAMQDVFGPAAPPTEAFLANAYAALSFNGGNLILHELIRYIEQRQQHRDRWVGALQGAEVPLALINGPADPISGRHAAEGFREAVPGARVTILPDGVGHYPQVEAPRLVIEAYLAFLKEVAS